MPPKKGAANSEDVDQGVDRRNNCKIEKNITKLMKKKKTTKKRNKIAKRRNRIAKKRKNITKNIMKKITKNITKITKKKITKKMRIAKKFTLKKQFTKKIRKNITMTKKNEKKITNKKIIEEKKQIRKIITMRKKNNNLSRLTISAALLLPSSAAPRRACFSSSSRSVYGRRSLSFQCSAIKNLAELAPAVSAAYGTLLLGGGLFAYARTKSTGSIWGGVSGAALMAVAYYLMQNPETKAAGEALGFGSSSLFAAVFAIRLASTRKFMPSGLLLGTSGAAMAVFVSAYLQDKI
ncbi:transmembrane proteins 14C [Wolffia australiana]